MAKALYKGFGCLHMAHTIGFGRFSLELLGAVADMAVVEIIEGFDIAIIFKPGTPRDGEDIMADARMELDEWTQTRVHRQYFTYTLGKLTGQRPAALDK